ncbi:MAG: molybdopterin-binding protein [Candidatus Bathyarchaeota archaeon]|nr:molybdopterin-binding protein [Candidatus Bathyarchaeota archaeon]
MFKKLVSLDEAKQIIATNFSPKPVGKESVPLEHAYNRILAEDIVAPIDVPPFNRSTVDGYAVKAEDTFGADEDRPVALKLCGQVRVGEPPKVTIEKGTTAGIVTGAPLPEGADAVVMFEDTVQKENIVSICASVSRGENVMEAGSDIHKGETALRKGQTLASYEIGVLAALGVTNVKVYKRPRVAILSTGAEVVEPGRPLSTGKIYDINAHALSAAVTECGGEPINLGIVEDESQKMEATFKKALNIADLIVTSGGVSVGPTDIIPEVLDTLGKPGVIVYGIAIKPGKPTTVAVISGKPVFSLPGHPTSALLIFQLLVRPVIAGMAGRSAEKPRTVKAVTATRIFAARGRRTFVTVHLTSDKASKFVASPVPLGLSGAITTLSKADGFIEIHESQQFIDAGEEVTVHLLKPKLY